MNDIDEIRKRMEKVKGTHHPQLTDHHFKIVMQNND